MSVMRLAAFTRSSTLLPAIRTSGHYGSRGLCLDVTGTVTTPGQQLDQWPCKNAPGINQDFTPN